ncbi:MAG: hypothetical protein WDA27_14655, partial [Actinomycetota bacterium]
MTLAAGTMATNFDGNVTFLKAAGNLAFQSGRNVTFGDAVTDTISLSGDAAGTVLISTTANNGDLVFNSSLGGSQALSLTTVGIGLISWASDLSLGATSVAGTNLSVSTARLDFSNNVDASTSDKDIVFLVDELNLGTSNTVSAGSANFRIAPRTSALSVEFAPVKVLTPGTTDIFIDSAFAGITAGNFTLGSVAQSGNIHIGNSTNAVTSTYQLSVLQNQAGIGRIQFENGYNASAANKNLSLTSGTGGIRFGNTVTPVALSLGTGAFASNGAAGGAGAVTVVQNTTITANGGISFLTANSTINSSAGDARTLSLQAGNSPAQLAGDVGTDSGSTGRLGSLAINTIGASGTLGLAQVFTIGNQTYYAGGGIALNGITYRATSSAGGTSIAFNGDATYNGSSLTVQTDGSHATADGIVFTGSIMAGVDATNPVSLLPGLNGTLSVIGDIGASASGRPSAVTMGASGNAGGYSFASVYARNATASGLSVLTNGLSSANGSTIAISGLGAGAVSFAGGVELAHASGLSIATNGVAGSSVSFASFARSKTDGAYRPLAVNSGVAATVFNGALGETANRELSKLSVTAGTVDFTAAVKTKYVDATNDGSVTLTNSALLTIPAAADFTLEGAFTQNGGALGLVSIAGDITTSDDTVSFARGITLTGNVAIGTGATGADVSFADAAKIDDDGTAGNADLTITAGSGTIKFGATAGAANGRIGGTNRIGMLTIVSAANVTASGSISAARILQSAGSSLTSFGSAVDTNHATLDGLSLKGAAFIFSGTVTTSGNGAVDIDHSGLLTITDTTSAGDIAGYDFDLSGSFLERDTSGTPTGTVSISGDIRTSGDIITFNRPMILVGNTALDSGTGADITLSNTVEPNTLDTEGLTLLAGIGNISVTGPVGLGKRIGTLAVKSAANSTFTNSVTAWSFTQTAGTGTTTLNGAVSLGAYMSLNVANIAVNANVLSITGHLTMRAGTDLTVSAGKSVTTGTPGTVSMSATSGLLLMSGTANATASSSSLRLFASGNLTVGNLSATNLSLMTSGGSVVNAVGSTKNATGTKLRLEANGSIGVPSRHLSTNVDSVTAKASTGSMYLTEDSSIGVGSVAVTVTNFNADATTTGVTDAAQADLVTLANGNIVLATAAGDVALDDGSTPADGMAVSANGSGNVLVNAAGNLGTNANVLSGTGHL